MTEHVSERNGSEEEGEKRGETVVAFLKMRGATGDPPGLPRSVCRCPHVLGKLSVEQPYSAPQCRGGPATGHSISLQQSNSRAMPTAGNNPQHGSRVGNASKNEQFVIPYSGKVYRSVEA